MLSHSNSSSSGIAVLPVLERIEQKRASVKYRLNELVDDLFAYLTSELTQQLTVPPDRLLLTLNHRQMRPHAQQQQQQQQLSSRSERPSPAQDDSPMASPTSAAVDLSLSSTSDHQHHHHHHYPHHYHQYRNQQSQEEDSSTNCADSARSGTTSAIAGRESSKQMEVEGKAEEPAEEAESVPATTIQHLTSNALPVIVLNSSSTKNNNNSGNLSSASSSASSASSSSSSTPITSKYTPERPPLTARASSEPPHPRRAALQQENSNPLFHPSTSTGGSSSSAITSVATVADDLDDLDDMDEHSDSDCDCEQCMGVPICKVDLDEAELRELKAAAAAAAAAAAGHTSSDRPTKRARISALATAASSINYSPSSPPSPLSTEAIADLQEDFHLQETVGEQCSATFKTISIKCSRDDCRSMFKNKVERNQHLLTVHGTQPYTCLMRDCNQGFDNVRQYGEHVNTEHKEVNHWPCTKCPKVCTDHRLLCRHIYFYHQEGRFKCRKSKCCFVAPYRIDVRKHSQLHTEMYACQFGCGKSFSHTHHRKRHERIHLRLKPFRCKLCQYCSEARSTVIRHIRIRHFNLPLTLKQQNELNIVDNRDPRDYMEILSELMN